MSNNGIIKNRTVNDFSTEDELRRGMMSMDITSSNEDREIPAARAQATSCGDDLDTQINENWDWALTNYDVENTEAQSISQELTRLQVLKSYLLLDAEREEAFERLTNMGSRIFNVPICLISLVDLGRQWFLSNRGLGPVRETPRNLAFCAHALLNNRSIFTVPDALKDPRFAQTKLVTGAPKIRFYAGAPLISPEGYKLGTFCIIDTKPRPDLSSDEKENLIDLSAITVKTMVDRRDILSQASPGRMIACTAHDLLTPLTGVQLSLHLLKDDSDLSSKLCEHTKELVNTAASSADIMLRICQSTIDSLRASTASAEHNSARTKIDHLYQSLSESDPCVDMEEFVKSVHRIIEPIPKRVPCIISMDKSAPRKILTEDLKIFRSALNLLTNANDATEIGSIHFRIFVKNGQLMFECEDTGNDIAIRDRTCLFGPCNDGEDHRADLGLYSVATQIDGLGGRYGYRPRCTGEDGSPQFDSKGRKMTGSIFWFSIPIVLLEEIHPSTPSNKSADTNFETPTDRDVVLTSRICSTRSNSSLSDSGDSRDHSRNGSILSVVKAAARGMAEPCTNCENFDYEKKATKDKNITGAKKKMSKHALESLGKRVEQNTTTASLKASQKKMDLVITAPKENEKPRLQARRDSVSNGSVVKSESIGRKKKALVIEDSVVVRKCLVKALSKLGYDVVEAMNGAIGLKELKKSSFDIALCDFLMPVMDGLDCVQQFREWERNNIPSFRQYIIGISAHASRNDYEKGLKIGMDDFKPKPVTIKYLTRMHESPKIREVSHALDELFKNKTNRKGKSMKKMKASVDENQMTVEGLANDDLPGKMKTNQARSHKDLCVSSSEEENDTKVRPQKRSKLEESSDDDSTLIVKEFDDDTNLVTEYSCNDAKVCLMVTDSIAGNTKDDKTDDFLRCMEELGWKAKIVQDGESAFRVLKLRNWGAVVVDDELPILSGIECISRFRDWESKNRVNRQNKIFLVCTRGIPAINNDLSTSVVQVPNNFDGVLNSPVSLDRFKELINKIESKEATKNPGQVSLDEGGCGLAIVTR